MPAAIPSSLSSDVLSGANPRALRAEENERMTRETQSNASTIDTATRYGTRTPAAVMCELPSSHDVMRTAASSAGKTTEQTSSSNPPKVQMRWQRTLASRRKRSGRPQHTPKRTVSMKKPAAPQSGQSTLAQEEAA